MESMGRMLSAVPWTISAGTSIRGMSAAEIREPGGLRRDRCGGSRSGCDVPAGVHGFLAEARRAQERVRVVEVLEEFREERVPVRGDRFGESVEDLLRNAVRVVVRLQEERFQGSQERGPGHARRTIGAQVAGNFTGTHGEAHQHGVVEFQPGQEGVEVRGEGVVVVALGGLAGFAETAAVVGDDAVAGLQEGGCLLFPGGSVQRVAVDQDDRLAAPVVFVVELDIGAVLGSNGDECHLGGPFEASESGSGRNRKAAPGIPYSRQRPARHQGPGYWDGWGSSHAICGLTPM